jgi:hypothetical protein
MKTVTNTRIKSLTNKPTFSSMGSLSGYALENSLITDLIVKLKIHTGCQWLTPVILATQEAEIRRINVQSQLRQIVLETLS